MDKIEKVYEYINSLPFKNGAIIMNNYTANKLGLKNLDKVGNFIVCVYDDDLQIINDNIYVLPSN